MRYNIPTIADADLALANSAEVGAETNLYASYDPVAQVADLTQGANLAGAILQQLPFVAPVGGVDMQVRCLNGIKSTVSMVLTFRVTFAGAVAGLARATFAVPDFALDQSDNLPIGLAVDLLGVAGIDATFTDGVTTSGSATMTSATAVFVVGDIGKEIVGAGIPAGTTIIARASGTSITLSANATATATAVSFTIVDRGTADNSATKIVSIDAIDSITGGQYGNRFEVIAGPERASYNFIQCCKAKNPTLPVGKSIAIPCGYEGSRWVKKGRSDPNSLEVTAVYTSAADGLMRLNGQRVTVMLETTKDDWLLTERQIFGGWRPVVKPTHPDGDAEAESTATGMFEQFAVFV